MRPNPSVARFGARNGLRESIRSPSQGPQPPLAINWGHSVADTSDFPAVPSSPSQQWGQQWGQALVFVYLPGWRMPAIGHKPENGAAAAHRLAIADGSGRADVWSSSLQARADWVDSTYPAVAATFFTNCWR